MLWWKTLSCAILVIISLNAYYGENADRAKEKFKNLRIIVPALAMVLAVWSIIGFAERLFDYTIDISLCHRVNILCPAPPPLKSNPGPIATTRQPAPTKIVPRHTTSPEATTERTSGVPEKPVARPSPSQPPTLVSRKCTIWQGDPYCEQ
jgi:hypothetical protein